jgi:hypothetical protein
LRTITLFALWLATPAHAVTPFLTEIVDSGAPISGDFCSIAADGNGNLHVSYYNESTDDLMYARKSGGVWTIETADGSPNMVGLMTSIALDTQGNPHVTYRDQTAGDLMYARRTGGSGRWRLRTGRRTTWVRGRHCLWMRKGTRT